LTWSRPPGVSGADTPWRTSTKSSAGRRSGRKRSAPRRLAGKPYILTLPAEPARFAHRRPA
jgi:hypothetical protein